MQLEGKQDTLSYLKRHQAIKFRKLTPTLLIQNYLFIYVLEKQYRQNKQQQQQLKRDIECKIVP